MNYYIQGDAANADKIKAAFEELGMSDLSGYNFGNGHALFYTYDCGGNKVIAIVCVSLHIADIIKSHPDYKELELPKPNYNIANFHAGMPVLVRADNSCRWDYSVFSRITGNEYWKFAVCNGVCFTQCIPFNEKTKHLLGTTDMPREEYINW